MTTMPTDSLAKKMNKAERVHFRSHLVTRKEFIGLPGKQG